jgi:AcrR family transcriptional regulator
MAPLSDGSTSPDLDTSTPRRSALLQARSRDTRRKLIRTALQLWDERGFERAIEDTTVEEIARAAGVSKGTFYFHFAHKEDILLEMPWATVEIMTEEAERAMRRGEPTGELVEQVMVSLGRRVSRAPRTAVLRVTGHWSRLSHSGTVPETPRGFGQVFHTVLQYARDRGELPPAADLDELASLLQAVTMDALVRWAATTQTPAALRATLCRRADVVLRGAAVSYGAQP